MSQFGTHTKTRSRSKLSNFDKLKQKNQKTYDALSREYNKLYLQTPTNVTLETIKQYDDDTFDGKLINESCILQVIEHGKYNDIDALKFFIPPQSMFLD